MQFDLRVLMQPQLSNYHKSSSIDLVESALMRLNVSAVMKINHFDLKQIRGFVVWKLHKHNCIASD